MSKVIGLLLALLICTPSLSLKHFVTLANLDPSPSLGMANSMLKCVLSNTSEVNSSLASSVDYVVKFLLKVWVVLEVFQPSSVFWVWFCAIIREVFLFLELATDFSIKLFDAFFDFVTFLF